MHTRSVALIELLSSIQSTNTIHKTEDILLSSTIAAAPVTSVMNMPVSELILQPSVRTTPVSLCFSLL